MTRADRPLADSGNTGSAAQCIALAGKACDQVDELSVVFKAYLALERFVSPEFTDAAQVGVSPSRAELGALLRTLNAEMLRQIGALADTSAVLQAQVAHRQAQG